MDDAGTADTAPPRRVGRIIVLLVAAVVWAIPSALAGGVVFIGLVGYGTENGDTSGALAGGGAGVAMVVSGLVVLALGGAVLLGIATWALRVRDQAVATAIVATCWAPSVLLIMELG